MVVADAVVSDNVIRCCYAFDLEQCKGRLEIEIHGMSRDLASNARPNSLVYNCMLHMHRYLALPRKQEN
jgi:hypothetical protein